MPVQLCATAAECLTMGDTCGTSSLPVPGNLPITICIPPTYDGGATDTGGVEVGVGEGGLSSGGDSGDAGNYDAPSNG